MDYISILTKINKKPQVVLAVFEPINTQLVGHLTKQFIDSFSHVLSLILSFYLILFNVYQEIKIIFILLKSHQLIILIILSGIVRCPQNFDLHNHFFIDFLFHVIIFDPYFPMSWIQASHCFVLYSIGFCRYCHSPDF